MKKKLIIFFIFSFFHIKKKKWNKKQILKNFFPIQPLKKSQISTTIKLLLPQ